MRNEIPKAINDSDPRLHVRKSTLHAAGRGLFAKKAMPRGEKILVQGVLIRRGSAVDRNTRYADAYKFRVGDYLLIPLGNGAMANHSSKPNLEKVVEGKTVYLRALRPIKAREELFFRYSTYAQKRFL